MALALFCLYTLVASLKDGAGMGVWLIALAVGMGCAWLTFDLSRRDITRWTRLTTTVGILAVAVGHQLAANSVA
ncbi:hypothetical protein [Streptomyces sp. NPDC002851]